MNYTTNRVESQHSRLKKDLDDATNCTLDRFVSCVDEIVLAQQNLIKTSFTNSKIKKMNDHFNIPVLGDLIYNMSHKGLDIMVKEVRRIERLYEYNRGCSCNVWTSCGLPCSCRLGEYIRAGRNYPLEEIDPFWRKLDEHPLIVGAGDTFDGEAEMDEITRHVLVQPKPIQKNWVSRWKSFINPSKTDREPPLTSQKPRGRPPKGKKDPPRHSSFVSGHKGFPDSQDISDQPYDTQESARHSDYSSQTNDSQKCQRSRKGKAVAEEWVPGDEEKNNFLRFRDFIPEIFHAYVQHTEDVEGDGNCGFRALAVGLGFQEHEWRIIRTDLLKELTLHRREYSEDMFNYKEMRNCLIYDSIMPAPRDKWLQMPGCGGLFANTYSCVVIFIDKRNKQTSTFFPTRVSAADTRPHRFITLAYMNNIHFFSIKLTGEFPLPLISIMYTRRYDRSLATDWPVLYKKRLDLYKALTPNEEPQYHEEIL